MLISSKLYRILLTFQSNHNYFNQFQFECIPTEQEPIEALFALQIQLEMQAIEQIVPKVQFGFVLVLLGTRRIAIAYTLHWPQETEICSTCHEHHFWSPYRGALLFWLIVVVNCCCCCCGCRSSCC